MSRLETIRNLILAAIEAKRLAGSFVENTFLVSTKWYPVTDYPGLATDKGQILVLGRPTDTQPMVRKGVDAYEEEFQFQVVILFAANNATETETSRISTHIELVEQIQDTLRTTIPLNQGITWTGTVATRDSAGTPYHFMEMDRGMFCAMFEIKFHTVKH